MERFFISELWLLPDNRTVMIQAMESADLFDWIWHFIRVDSQTGMILGSWKSGKLRPHESFERAAHSADGQVVAFKTFRLSLYFGGDGSVDIHVIDMKTLQECVVFNLPSGWEDPVPTALTISPDNKTLAVGLTNGTVVLYDLQKHRQKTEMK
jgi:WD40 repeat protein